MTPLEKRMVLHRFMCGQFNCENLRKMLDMFDNLPEGFVEGGSTRFSQILSPHLRGREGKTTKDDIKRYDENIITHSQTLGITDEHGKTWKPFQYIALLFTERYLDLYFQDPEILIASLNEWKYTHYRRLEIVDYTPDDIRTLAFQSATGSGKTLLLHANILQYKHYLEENQRLHKLNKIILVTPDEGLSRQHLRELQASNIPAQLFSDNQTGGVFSQHGAMVDIIDLHKLDEKKGVKRVALDAFEENNLVMVDEGHLGTGGKVWRKRRKQLAKNGFTFEYSATFNQAVSGGGDGIKKLRDEYGKSILFDYSYKFFYEDGYGKDYKISNLPTTDDAETNNLYLMACLLMFYQQCRIYQDKGGQWQDFNIAPPLWVFLGKTVTGGKKVKPSGETETDIVRIVNFLSWVLSKQQQATANIRQLLSDAPGLVDGQGREIFGDAFSYIKGKNAREIYDDLCLTVFHAKGQLRLSHLTGGDELQLAAGDANPFAVINVGDASGLYTRLEAVEDKLFHPTKDSFSAPLFAGVDNDSSPINIVIGARKFAAGWNSWRVSTMGLMHVGTGEGPQIIQMFGRGVRLKGHGMSLKRHTAPGGVAAEDSDQLKLLETLNIFGLKANYMEKFREYLQKDGVVDYISVSLPTKKQFEKVKGLKILKKHGKAGDFQHSDERFDLFPAGEQKRFVVELDRYKQLQTLTSAGPGEGGEEERKEKWKFEPDTHLSFINRQAIYHKVLQRKRRLRWHNMRISQKMVNDLLDKGDEWYRLFIPSEKLELTQYERVREWENIAVDLVCEYADRRWRNERNNWEHEHMEVAPLDDKDLNYVDEYKLSVPDNAAQDLIRRITDLAEQVEQDNYPDPLELHEGSVQLSLLSPSFHAYRPLLWARSQGAVQISPAPLNEGEGQFVKYLQIVAGNMGSEDFLKGKEIYLMRNLSGGKGISFFEDHFFYPDFILWVKNSKRQDVLFIDPKGLMIYNSKVARKVKLHEQIKDTEKEMQKTNPEIFLHSYVWSVTPHDKIGNENPMTEDEYRSKGIYFAQRGPGEIIALLHHALHPTPPKSPGNTTTK